MSNPETTLQEVLQDTAEQFSFDNLVHLACLAALSQDTGIPPSQWRLLSEAWDYQPTAFFQHHKRGNCINFAAYTQDRLAQSAHTTHIIGELAAEPFTQRQQKYLGYAHMSLMSRSGDERALYEPGWNCPYPIPVRPAGETVVTGSRKFTTVEIKEDILVQRCVSPSGHETQRTLSFVPLTAAETVTLAKKFLRIPRRLEICKSLSPDRPRQFITLDPGANNYRTNVDGLPSSFAIDDLDMSANKLLSGTFGFDVKEELLVAAAFCKRLPETFWV